MVIHLVIIHKEKIDTKFDTFIQENKKKIAINKNSTEYFQKSYSTKNTQV